jgi:hypothetical protein
MRLCYFALVVLGACGAPLSEEPPNTPGGALADNDRASFRAVVADLDSSFRSQYGWIDGDGRKLITDETSIPAYNVEAMAAKLFYTEGKHVQAMVAEPDTRFFYEEFYLFEVYRSATRLHYFAAVCRRPGARNWEDLYVWNHVYGRVAKKVGGLWKPWEYDDGIPDARWAPNSKLMKMLPPARAG